ncbi:MAG: hypothetical protein QM783_06830 [Phycisphaerales bacterium]
MSVAGREHPTVHQYTQQHDRAGDGHRHAEHEGGLEREAESEMEDRDRDARREQALPYGARYRDPLHRQQVLHVEVQAHAEHQQDDADLGKLMGQVLIALIAGRVRPDEHARGQIPDDRRQP